MSIFKRMIKTGLKDEELMNEVCGHLRQIGISATTLESEPKIHAFTNYLGSIKVEGRNIDLLEVEMKMVGGGDMGAGTSRGVKTYRYNYVVSAKIDGLEDKLKAATKLIKKGFLRKEVVGLKWEGGDLAQLLNADSDLKTMLDREGLVEHEIRSDKKSQCIRIRQKKFYLRIMLPSPTREAFEIYDRIAQHIRSIAGTQGVLET